MFIPLVDAAQTIGIFANNTLTLVLGFLTSAILCYAIFLFKNRKKQMLLCKVAVGALLLELVLAVFVFFLKYSEGLSWVNWGGILPIGATVLVYLAHRAIYRDEQLVRSADRLR